ncbi:Protein-associating with the carboxyl-terminal domain of ezrin [Mortierella sp. GBA43]|nr:Protein-associating with the carboxyl-terminal domain of ezrin [Mortierella sp. GBA43]
MGAAESRPQGSGAAAGEGSSSKAKLVFAPGSPPLVTTPVYTLRDAFLGKRPVSVFTFDPDQFALGNKKEFLPKAIRKLKTIRHPSVLRFIDCKFSSTGAHLITEPVVPLTPEYLEDITEDEILIGLYDIMVALRFLHSQCRVSHNNVQLGSIFVSNGRWVLGGMEFTGTGAESMESGFTSSLAKELVPPELQGQAKTAPPDLAYAVDIWQYGKLVESLIQDQLLRFKQPSALPLDRMLSTDPRKRPTGDVILESNLFVQNNGVSVVRYCRLKGLDKTQNAEWTKTIMSRLHLLPPSIMEKFVLPQLLTQEFFAAEGFDKLYRTLFTPQPPQPLISEAIYRKQVMPFMIKLWTYRTADIRMTILRLFEVYLKAVVMGEGGSEVLGQIILPEILTGLQDADSKVYLASLCGLATTIPYALLVTTLVETEAAKQKFSVKALYEQTLIPQIMAFWISEDCTQEAKMELVEVVMGMWCSIYTLGLHNHPAVKDMSATLTLTLVSVLKLSTINERVELISKSCTKHCTNGLFCISGLLKFLPQFLLDEDPQVRKATAQAISSVAEQTITLISSQDSTESQESEEQQRQLGEGDVNGTSAGSSSTSTPSAHVSKIRQYCEKQQTLLPPRRPIFSRSAFASERNLSSNSLRNYNGVDGRGGNGHVDHASSRRSSMVSQDSFMFSEQGSLRTPSTLTPSGTRSGSFSADATTRDNTVATALGSQKSLAVDKSTTLKPNQDRIHVGSTPSSQDLDIDMDAWDASEEDLEAADQIELMKALEAAKEEMRVRQLPATQSTSSDLSSSVAQGVDNKRATTTTTTAFGWDADDDDGDDWDNDDLASSNKQTVEDEKARLKREEEKAEKQEQLRLKREQKQQEMQAKREARRQQLADKQGQKKVTSNGVKLGAIKTAQPTTTLGTGISSPTPTPTTPAAPDTSKPASSRSLMQAFEASLDEKDDWDLDGDVSLSALDKQAGSVEDALFEDMGVDYKAPAYVGNNKTAETGLGGSSASISSSVSSSMTLSNSTTTITNTTTTATTTTATTTTAAAAATKTASTLLSTSTAPPVSTGSLSIQSTESTSRGSSPTATPKRVASPLMRTTSNSSVNTLNSNHGGQNNGYGNKSAAAAAAVVVPPSPTTSTTSTTATAAAAAKPSLALQMDEAVEEDAWGDDWD